MDGNHFNIHRSSGPDKTQKSRAEFDVDPGLFGETLADALAAEEGIESVQLGPEVDRVSKQDSRPPIMEVEKPVSDGEILELFNLVRGEMKKAGVRL